MGLDRVTSDSSRNLIANSFKSNTDPFQLQRQVVIIFQPRPRGTRKTDDNQVTSATINVEGARVGDPVAVGFSQPVPAGALLVGAVTAPNVITFTLFNKTGRTLDLPRGMLRADVWKHAP